MEWKFIKNIGMNSLNTDEIIRNEADCFKNYILYEIRNSLNFPLMLLNVYFRV